MFPPDQTVEMFKPQPNMTLDIKPEEVSNNDNQLNLIENPNVKTNPRSRESQIGDQKMMFGDDNNDLFSTQLANSSSLPSYSHDTLFAIQDDIAKPIEKTKHPVKVIEKLSTMKTTKKEHKHVQSIRPHPHNHETNLHAHNKDPFFDDDIAPLQKEEVKSKPKERLKNSFF